MLSRELALSNATDQKLPGYPWYRNDGNGCDYFFPPPAKVSFYVESTCIPIREIKTGSEKIHLT